MNLTPKTIRRSFGAVCLLAVIGMLVAGQTVLGGKLSPAGFLLYWLGCLIGTVLAILTALADLRALRQQTRDEQRAAFEQTLQSVSDEKTRADPRLRP